MKEKIQYLKDIQSGAIPLDELRSKHFRMEVDPYLQSAKYLFNGIEVSGETYSRLINKYRLSGIDYSTSVSIGDREL